MRYAERKKDPEWHRRHLERVNSYRWSGAGKIAEYRASAKWRGYECSLTDEEFHAFFSLECFYCGLPGGGIDRYDNNVGYILENCVPCCRHCNYAKRDRTVTEFLAWIDALALRRGYAQLKGPEEA